jgi:hypothetical protein
MPSPSNLYAEKIFAEHPIALWALDDKTDYVSIIDESNRKFFDSSKWTISSNATAVQANVTLEPFIESSTTRVTATGTSPTNTVTLISSNIKRFIDLSSEDKTFSIGLYLYDETGSINSVSIGYEYLSSPPIQVTKDFSTSMPNRWVFVSETFPFQNLLSSTDQIRLVVKVTYSSLPSTTEYKFLLNGLTFGQWSENFNTTSLGASLIDLPTSIALPASKAIEAKAYGVQDFSGYYISNGSKLFAKNSGVPMVYGASNTTSISPLENSPSLILPGTGFLNKSGQFRSYTVEMWLRINSNEFGSKRIFGPIASQDGLYVDGAFLTFKIGNSEINHFVGEWFRPMLVHLRVIDGSASLMLNGEEVGSVNFITSELQLPNLLSQSGKSQDWVGFYAYEDVSPIEIDCVAIYPYSVPAVVAKRRWVYGQGVEFPEKVNTAYNGTSIFVDYPFANYANNYSYPDIGSWNQGTTSNLKIENNILSTNDYLLPEILTDIVSTTVIGASNPVDDLISDIGSIQTGSDFFINLVPTEDWEDSNAAVIFENAAFLKDDLKAILGVFKITEALSEEKPLIKIVDDSTNSYFSINANAGNILYKFKYLNSAEQTVYTDSSAYTLNNKFFAGVNIDAITTTFGSNMGLFWGNKNRLKVYVAGDFSKTFTGNVYRIDFCNAKNLYRIKDAFLDNGIINSDYSEDKVSQFASYSLLPKYENGIFFLDFGTNGSWQDYLPLSYFAKNVLDINGDQYYDLDFIQFNVNYPKFRDFVSEAGGRFYNTFSSDVRFYITFQTLQSGANIPTDSFLNTQRLLDNDIIQPGSEWTNTKYEVLDGTLIYLPNDIKFEDIALVTHIEFNSEENINKKYKLKTLQYASQSFSQTTPTAVGTRFGKKIYPYKQTGIYFSYKDNNPFSIYKGSTPYLYLTKNSGIKLLGDITDDVNRGLSIPINENLISDYKIIATQFSVLYDQDVFPTSPTKIFEIEGRDVYLKFFLLSSQPDGKRAKIFAVDGKTGQERTDLVFYVNGNLTYLPTINLNEWLMLGITFPSPVFFRSYSGAIRVNGPLLINNISYYESTNLQEVQLAVNRPWSKVLNKTESEDYIWNFWNETFVWGDVLVVSTTSSFGVDASNIYKTYTGTNKIIVDDTKSDTDVTNAIVLQEYEYNVFQGISLDVKTITAV